MGYCYECGSEVAENSAFCPYCGINLKTNDAESIGGAVASRAGETTAAGKLAENEKENRTILDFAPVNIEKNNAEVFAPEKTDNQIAGDKNETAADGKIVSDIDNDNQNKDFDNQTESNLMAYEEAEVQENLSIEDSGEEFNLPTETAVVENASEPEKPEVSEEISSLESNSENADNSESENADDEIAAEAKAENLFQARAANLEKPIAKPETELASAEANCPPARFDSVRIMQQPDLISKENSDSSPGENPGIDESAVKISPLETQISRSAQPPSAARSFTAQNISVGDTDGRKSAKLKPLAEGTVLNGRYEIVRKIGGGGMGAVYLASDKNLGGVLRAVKEMVQSYIEDAQQEKAVSDFKRESLLLTSLEHQSIPTIYDYFFDDREARFYLVMKYISGGDLASRLRSAPENRIEEKTITEWAMQIADVLDYLHNRQPAIIYRDLKPANIMIDGNSSRVMLIDFGIARWVNKEEKGVTAVGTMGYAPPELFSGNVEPRSDVYSLGSTMFHLLTGADPQSNPLLIFDFQKHPRPRQINSQISDQMEKILMRAVEYSADKRFASAAEMRDALAGHLENLKAGKVTYGIKETPSPAAFSDQPVFCGFCGQKIVATDMFCAFCGAKQPLAQKGVLSPINAAARRTARILIIGTGALETPSFNLEKDENLVGRRDPVSNIFPEIDLSKFDPQTKISRRHARIRREAGSFIIEDLGSSNGTIVLPKVQETVRLLPRQPFTLNDGDKIKIGDTTLHFVVAG